MTESQTVTYLVAFFIGVVLLVLAGINQPKQYTHGETHKLIS